MDSTVFTHKPADEALVTKYDENLTYVEFTPASKHSTADSFLVDTKSVDFSAANLSALLTLPRYRVATDELLEAIQTRPLYAIRDSYQPFDIVDDEKESANKIQLYSHELELRELVETHSIDMDKVVFFYENSIYKFGQDYPINSVFAVDWL